MSHHDAGPATAATLAGQGFRLPEDGLLETSSFALDATSADGQLVLDVIRGGPQPEQVLRLLYRDGVIARTAVTGTATDTTAGDGHLEVTVEAASAHDTAVYTAGVAHRLLYRRVYDPAGPRVVWFGFNPFLAELEGDPDRQLPRPSFRNIVGMARNELGSVGALTVLNLFTRRSDEAADITADALDARTPGDLIDREVAGAHAVIAAWGGSVGEAHLPQVRALWDRLRDVGLPLLAPAENGEPKMTATWPRQPRHPSRLGYKRLGLAPLPDRWIRTFRT